jgi:Tfp pilus assembly protein PilF
VKLQPGKVYWLGINAPPHTTFMALDGARARRHVLLFATKSADGKPTPIPDDLLTRAKAIIASAGKPAPTVVATSPKALANDVPASLKGISVTFDQEMMDGSWSWVQISKESYPRMTGQPSYDKARKTCTLPVELQPGKVYWLGVNSEEHKFFQTAADTPARPYVILFATRGKDGKPTPIPSELVKKAEAINRPAPSEADRQAAESLATEGWKLWGQRRLAEAEEKFSQAVRKDPANANAWNGLGWAQQNQGKLADAEQSFRKCLAIDPRQAGAWNGLGWIAKIRKDPDKAIGYWQKAVEALPTGTAALNGLTTTLVELGRHAEAVKYYEMWLKAEPDNAGAKAGLEKARQAAKGGRKRP